MKIVICILVVWRCGAHGQEIQEKKGKLLSPFAVVQFPNLDCVSSEGISGEDPFMASGKEPNGEPLSIISYPLSQI